MYVATVKFLIKALKIFTKVFRWEKKHYTSSWGQMNFDVFIGGLYCWPTVH